MSYRNLLVPFGVKPKPIDDGPRYADTNDRAMAAALDIVLLFYLLDAPTRWLNQKIFAAYGMSMPEALNKAEKFTDILNVLWQVREPWLLANGVSILLMGLLVVGCQYAYGVTPGKWLLGLRIVRADTLERPSLWRYVLRFVGYGPACAPLMIGIFWMSFNKRHRAWQDYIADTVVINLRPRYWLMNKIKAGIRKLRGKPPLSAPVEEAVGEPAAAERHEDGSKPVD